MKLLFGTFYIFLVSLNVFSDSAQAPLQSNPLVQAPVAQMRLEQGIQAYQQNDFEKALGIFERLNQSICSAGLFGYIGNCHLKMNHLGQGIANYLSALKRSPGNPDLRHNLEYALSQTPDQISISEEMKGLLDVCLNTVRLADVSTHRIIFCALFILLILVFGWHGIFKNNVSGGRLWISLLFISLIFQGAALYIRVADFEQKQGVVILPLAKVRYGPSQTDTEAFLLHVGSPFEIRHREGSWVQIRLKDGKAGWLPSESFMEVK